MNIRKYLDSLDLREDESRRMNCPSCYAKNTFTVTKEMGQIKYNCYKLDCSIGGYHHTDLTAAEIKILMAKQEKPMQLEPETMEIPEYVVTPKASHTKHQRYVRRWGIALGDTMYDVKDERVVFPIKHEGRIVDAVGRAVGKKQNPKWYRYTGEADYYTIGTGSTLLIVEDVVSAVIAVQEMPYITAMAILGTALTAAHMDKISEYDNVIVALDPDAAHKTLQFSREIALWTNANSTAFRLDDDIKYRLTGDLERLKELLS